MNIKMKEKLLVIGGTGKTGARVANNLRKMGHSVRIGGRKENPAFDWGDSSTWGPVLEGMDKAYIVYYPDLAVPGAKEAIEGLTKAAKAANLKKLVLLSGKGEVEAEHCEQIVINSSVDYTIVRASWFNQNFSESFLIDPVLAGHVALPRAEAQIPFIDADDIADVVAQVLTDDSHSEKIYQLTGPRTWTFGEIIEEIANATGRDIHFDAVSLEAYAKMLESAGLPDDYAWLINYLFDHVLGNPKNQEVTNDVEKVLGRKAKDFSEYVNETAKTGVWNQD